MHGIEQVRSPRGLLGHPPPRPGKVRSRRNVKKSPGDVIGGHGFVVVVAREEVPRSVKGYATGIASSGRNHGEVLPVRADAEESPAARHLRAARAVKVCPIGPV